jgi:hypothetical protein
MCRMESSLTLPRVVRGAESLGAGYALVGLQPTGHGSPGERLCRCQGYYGQFADSLELLHHFHMLVFAPDPRRLVAGDRVALIRSGTSWRDTPASAIGERTKFFGNAERKLHELMESWDYLLAE